MRQIDLSVQVEQLRSLAERFTALSAQLRTDQRPKTGAEGLARLSKRLTQSHALTADSVAPLTELVDSQATQLLGSQSALNSLGGGVVERASHASMSLAAAIASNEYDANWYPQPDDRTSDWDRRQNQARRDIRARLIEAADNLGTCGVTLRHVANALGEQTRRFAIASQNANALAQAAPTKLSETQHAALTALAKGGAQIYDRALNNRPRVQIVDGTHVAISTIISLIKHGLLSTDTRTRLRDGQAVTVTAEGHQALARHQAAASHTTATAPVPAPIAGAKGGVRR